MAAVIQLSTVNAVFGAQLPSAALDDLSAYWMPQINAMHIHFLAKIERSKVETIHIIDVNDTHDRC